LNLAVNARDAMPGGGTLTIETRSIELDDDGRVNRELGAGRYVQLSVSDTGGGMTPDVREHAFEPFFTTKPREAGSGLGLATVYGIVTEAGGAVRIYSEEDLGTTVRVYFPAIDEPAPRGGERRGRIAPGGRDETILVVEDEDAMRKVTSRILRLNGYLVLEAASGNEALDIAAKHDLQLLLTDVVMPMMSGRELADRFHERRPGLPVLFMSGYSQGVLGPQRALDQGVALIEKPFNEQALLEKIHSIMTATRATAAASQPPDSTGQVRR
jgi:CheY-like chemotaxis protein